MINSLPAAISDLSGWIRYLSFEGVDANAGKRAKCGDKTTGKRCAEVVCAHRPGNRLGTRARNTTFAHPSRVVDYRINLDSGS